MRYTVWIDVDVPDDLEESSGSEVLAAVLLPALRESDLEPRRFSVEVEGTMPAP